jgi:hypothetical protein
MTLEEYKTLYPRENVFVQIDGEERMMTVEEYEAWCIEGVYWANHDPFAHE